MSVLEWIGAVIGVLVFLWGVVYGLVKFGRALGQKEKDIEHTDKSLMNRITELEKWKREHEPMVKSIGNLKKLAEDNKSDIDTIMSKIEGGEFWEQMKRVIHEVKSGTGRIKRDE